MSAYRVVVTEAAERDLSALFDVIAFDFCNPQAAIQHVAELREAANSLGEMPERFPLSRIPIFARLGIREMSVKKFKVIYQVLDNHKMVIILAAVGERRDLATVLSARILL
jgi:plasmid stabilization system protein ParE